MLHAGRRTSSAHSLPLTRMLERLGRSALPAGIATALLLAMTTTMALAQMTRFPAIIRSKPKNSPRRHLPPGP